ncbi:acyl-CoA thioesterase [Bacillus sp. T33-2]|uniref:acyl-CoA thioesterase n=1 Tax=Bacillus sp. T33-2 TaxID=2054168 RepID=UPI000C788135|nr:thioesterase family protein [Bacillus sp. T33-2]PLR93782.1 acyl-CoA thioesterase [Bacillus sp. T33-2]
MANYQFSHRLKVRYSEIDGQKIVFNAHYLTYLDVAVAEYFEEGLRLDLAELARSGEFDFVLAKTTLEFKSPARLNDWLNVWCRVASIGNSSITMNFKITRDGEIDPLLLAEIIYVSYDPHTKSSRPVPDFVRERIGQFEQTEGVKET